MKVNDLFTTIDSEYDNSYSSANKLGWINELELRYKLEVDQDISFFELSRIANTAGYSMPAGVQFTDFKIVFIDRVQAEYIDLTSFEKKGYYKGTDGKFTVYPVPTVSDITPGIRAVHIVRPTTKLIANILTDDLLIPDEFINVYKYYAFFKMALLNREFGEANNWSVMFNDEFKALGKWVQRTKPLPAAVMSGTKNVM